MHVDHRLVIEIRRRDGTHVGHAAVAPDWDPAIEATRLAGLRTRGIWAPESSAERQIEPLWHSRLGEPHMRGFRVHLARDDGEWYEDFSLAYFADLARPAIADLLEHGKLTVADEVLYRVAAYALERDGREEARLTYSAVDHPPPLPIHESPRPSDAQESRADDAHDEDFGVYIPAPVLEEASALTRAAGDEETGGVLIGHIQREPATTDIFVEVTALIPARHTVGHPTKLTFTSDTWTDVRNAVELRRRNELVLGWFHSHPQHAWCREKGCSIDEQRQCSAARGFLSSDDISLHRTMFSRAFTVALVMTRSIQGIVPRLFGWRGGHLRPRSFHVLATGAVHDATATVA